jgi:lysophospholipase L1-like esterase
LRERLLLAVFSMTFILVVAEMGLRVIGVRPLNVRSVSKADFNRVPGMYEPGLDVTDHKIPELPHEIHVNAFGFRGPETTLVPDRPRVVCIGDSFMWGDGVNDNETLPAQLERLFDGEVEFLNGGVAGSTIQDQRPFLERLLVMQPDAVLLLYSENDLMDMLADPSFSERLVQARDARSGMSGLVYSLLRGTAVVELALRAREAWRSRQLVERFNTELPSLHWNDELLESYTNEVSEMHAQLEALDIRLLVVAFPWPQYVTTDEDGSIPPLVESLQKADIEVVNLTRPLRQSNLDEKELYLLPYDGHPAAKGYAVVAAAIEPHYRQLFGTGSPLP